MPTIAQLSAANAAWQRPATPAIDEQAPQVRLAGEGAVQPFTGLSGMPVRGGPPVGLALDSDLTQVAGIGLTFQGVVRSRVYVPATPPWLIKNISIWPSTV